MRMTFRARIVLTLAPLLGLLATLGLAATLLLYRLGGRIDAILRENYDSVRFMQQLREAVEQIDSSFQLVLAGVPDEQARREYLPGWRTFENALAAEFGNITLPGEREAADRLAALAARYRERGDAFHKLPPGSELRRRAYFDADGLSDLYGEIKQVSERILALNQHNMEDEESAARTLAHRALWGFGLGVLATIVLAAWLAVMVIGATVRPIRLVTESALAIGEGRLDQVIAVPGADELGQLAGAFNTMARQLREFRASGQAQLLRVQQASQATIDSFPDPVVVVDGVGQVELANPAAQRILGVQVSASLPPNLLELVRQTLKEERPYLPEEFDRALRVTVSGSERVFLPRVLPIAAPTAQTLGAAVLLQDVTRFRLLDQIKSDLVATVSHELKTPLTSIRLALHLLLEEVIGPLTPKQTELLVDARDNGERLLRMVNNLLDLARLEKGKSPLELRPEQARTLIDAALEPFRPRAAAQGVTVEVAVPGDLPPVAADAQRLQHALANLLDNALVYTPAGGQVSIAATDEGEHVVLTVSDTGAGIAAEHVPHIFDKFYRIPGQSKESGSGLGLAIVREVMLAHGGSVSCASKPGEGSTFRLSLPIWKGQPG